MLSVAIIGDIYMPYSIYIPRSKLIILQLTAASFFHVTWKESDFFKRGYRRGVLRVHFFKNLCLNFYCNFLDFKKARFED